MDLLTLTQINAELGLASTSAQQLAKLDIHPVALNAEALRAMPDADARRLRGAKAYPADTLRRLRAALAPQDDSPDETDMPGFKGQEARIELTVLPPWRNPTHTESPALGAQLMILHEQEVHMGTCNGRHFVTAQGKRLGLSKCSWMYASELLPKPTPEKIKLARGRIYMPAF